MELGWKVRSPLETAHSLIPVSQGKPKPRATWTHNGCALDASRVSVRNGEQDSILFIREAQRADSGRYQLSVQLGGLEATATIDIAVIGMVWGLEDRVVLRGFLSRLRRAIAESWGSQDD